MTETELNSTIVSVHTALSKPCNHGDLLRSMSNAELARYLYIESNRMTEAEWLEWLDRGVAE